MPPTNLPPQPAVNRTRRLVRGGGFLMVALIGLAGCRSTGLTMPFNLVGPPAPVVLQPTATAADVVAAVNANASRVQTYQAPSASISMPESAGLPLIQASLAAERPLRFRLRATTALTGPEIDLGSNDERFWVWARRNEPPALYTARHDQWAANPMRGQVPIEPTMLIDAVGLVSLDPNAAYVGPVPRGDGSLELRTQIDSPAGSQQRVYVIDAQSAWVKEQHVYDAGGSLTASVFADRYEYDPANQVSLPRRVRLSVPAAGLDLTINTGPITTNAPIGAGQVWSLPQLPGTPTVDLTSPGAAPAAPAGPWDLTGTSTTYGATEPLATQFGNRSQAAAPAADAWQASTSTPRTEPQPTPAANASQGFGYPATTPVPSPQQAPTGFVGLPVGGRSLD